MCINSVARHRIVKDIRVIAVCNFVVTRYCSTELKTFPLCYTVSKNTPATTNANSLSYFIIVDKILISIHRMAMIMRHFSHNQSRINFA